MMWETIRIYIATNLVELIGFVFTVVSIWLNTKQNPWGWGVGILGIICYEYISLKINLLGSFVLNLYFLVVSIYGWYWWRAGRKEKTISISHCSVREWWLILGAVSLFGVALAGLLYRFDMTIIQYWDVETTAFSLIGQWLLARKKIENWAIWLWVNVQYIFIYYYQNLFVTCVLYVVLALLALKGWYEWKKSE